MRRIIDEFKPDWVHFNTEGPIGMAASVACRKLGIGFTTSFRTRFPEYINARLPIPADWIHPFVRCFHNGGRDAWSRPKVF